MGIYDELAKCFAKDERPKKIKYRVLGGHLGAQEFNSKKEAYDALPKIYHDNLYKWQKQVPLTIWRDTYTEGKRFPDRDIEKTFSVDELAKLV